MSIIHELSSDGVTGGGDPDGGSLAAPAQQRAAPDAEMEDRDGLIHELIAARAALTPDAVAAEFEGATLTCAELDARATRLARRLRALGVGVESRVGVCAGRSLELVVALLAVLKAGAAYVPLDPAYPRERLAGMIEDGGVRLVLAQPGAAERLAAGAVRIEALDRAEADAAGESAEPFESGATAESLAYVLFTSGSTGRPKGVMVPHRAVARLLEGGEWCRFAPDEVFLQFVPIAFDVSTFEIWGPLSCGARLVLFPPHTPSLEELSAFVRGHGITTLWLTSGLFHPMVDAHPESFAGVRRLLSGGDVVSPAHVRRVLEANPGLVFVNGYGPTEVTTYTTCQVVRSPDEVGATVSIGRPIARTTVHLLDAALRPVGEGEEGELCAGGAGVARGYQGRPALTAERFVPDPVSGTPGARLYRTGDRARRNPDGTLEYLGRIDQQVKIRGFRVEPGEVEAVLAGHPLLRQAAVVARGEVGKRRLVGYVVPADGAAPDEESLRAHLRATLPEYMVPSAFVYLDALPVNPNGKVDRHALPAPEAAEQAAREARHASPRTPAEELLAGIWAEVLGVERVGVHDDVFALGAHSLASMQVASRVRQALGAELPLSALFEHRTVAELARAAEAHAGSAAGFPPILPGERGAQVPPSYQQESVWFLQQLEPAGRSYHFQATLAFRGALDVAVLERALGEIVRRHELLHTTFPDADGQPVQRMHAPWPVHLPVVDFSRFSAEEQKGEIARWMEAQFEVPFDLASLPLMRWSLLKLAPDHHVLVQVEHHLVHDGWSMNRLLGELVALYRAFAAGEPSPLPELEVQYADYAAWQRRWMESEAARAQLDFWRRRLAGGAPVLELPADRRRPPVPSFRGAAPRFRLPQELYQRLHALGRAQGATLFMTMMAAFQAVLSRWSGETDLHVGTGMACRRQREVERLIGMFVNMTVVRTDASGDPTFTELLARVRRSVLDAYAHQDVPFDAVVNAVQPERALGHNPLFQVGFNFHDSARPDLDLPGLELELEVALPNGSAKFDLNVIVIPHAEQRLGRGGEEEGMTVVWEYAADLFDAATAERMFAHFRRALEAVADDPETRVSALPLLDAEERARVVEEWNATAAEYPRVSVAALFSEVARRAPNAIALLTQDGQVTYGELEARANRLARALLRRGVGLETRVGLCIERGVEQVTALLAILKAGGAYVPLDPAYPAERLAYMVQDSAVRLVLTQPELADRIPADAAEIVLLDAALTEAAREDVGEVESGAGPESPAYVVYTSGSTGQPKGVMVPHRAVVRLVRGSAFLDFSPDQVFLGFAPVAFDASTLELWGPLLNGGALALHPPEQPSLEELGSFIRAQGVTTLWLTAGLFHQMVDEQLESLGGLRQLVVGGDVLSPAHVGRVLERFPRLRLINGYGPTENTTFTCCHDIRPEDVERGAIPIGRPIANTRVYVLDAALRPVPVGVPGELCAAGDGLALGYVGRPELTAEKFVEVEVHGRVERVYRTGDRVRWRDDGTLEFLGRTDEQVKVRGFRIEPGEVEAALLAIGGVKQATVVPRPDPAGGKRLVAYVVGEAMPAPAELRDALRRTLPEYMVPAFVVALEALPLSPNGKVDRRALPAPELAGAEDEYEAPRTPVEEVLAGIWAELLGRERVGVAESFFDLGGHSLLAVRVVSRIREALSAELPLRALFEAPTVGELAARVEEVRRAGRAPLPPVVPVERTAALPLSFAQERLWFLDRLGPGSALFNIPAALRLRGALDLPALERALGELVRRHEALRTTFREVEGVPVQVIAPAAPFPLPVEELSGDDAELQRRMAAEAARPFDLAAGPLFRALLLRAADDDHVLLLCMHHAVSDGWSLGVLFRELSALYEAYAKGEESPLAPLPVQYADYAVWQREQLRGPALEGELAWWCERLAGAPALLELPLDHPRPPVQSFRGAEEWLELPPERVARLRALGRGEGATLYMVLLAAFQVLLAKYAGTDDVVVGSPVAGRARREVEGLIGLFANVLALRTDLSGDPDLREAVRRVRGVTLGAWEHQEAPFEAVVEALNPDRSLSHAPLFQAAFALVEDTEVADALGGAAAEALEVDLGLSKYELYLRVGAGGRVTLSYATDLYEPATARRMLAHLARVLAQAADDPSLPLSRLAPMDEAERRAVLEEWSRTEAPPPADGRCIHHLFAEQAARTPDAEALRFGGRSTTYRELDEASSRLARHLAARGVRLESRVGVLAERAPGTVAAILAILKAGGAYVPLDPAYPAERLRYMLHDCGARLVVAPAGVPDALAWELAAAELLDPRAEADAIAARPATPPVAAVDPDGLAYVIYTSGSTGRPKGVMVTHRGIPPFVRAGSARVGLDASARVLQFASFSFDAAVWETFATLAHGATLVMAPREELLPGPALAGTLRRERISLVVLPPSVLALLEPDDLPELRTVLSAGEALTPELVERWSAGRTLVNAYGPTEATVCPCMELCRADGGTPPIGRPLGRARLYVLDAAGEPVPAGVAGELHVGGAGVARGYLGRPGLTAERFVPDPFGPAGALLYRTGDRARWRADGTLLFAGRVDGQVKIRGYRVEPGEIEAVLRRHPGVAECVVVLREDLPGGPRLVAYVVGEADGDALRPHLRGALPEYMVPGAFVQLDALPRMPGGKPDRRALPAPPTGGTAHRLRPGTALEARIAALWQELLGVGGVGVEDNFFDLGGHSLLLVRLQARLAAELGREVPVADLFQHPTVRSLAARLQGEAGDVAAEEGEERGGARQAAAERIHARRRRAGSAEGAR